MDWCFLGYCPCAQVLRLEIYGDNVDMLLEDQRFIHEDLERLEQAIADRVAEKPANVSVGRGALVIRF